MNDNAATPTGNGQQVKVRDDATMWGDPLAAPSVYAGREGVVVDHPSGFVVAPYDVWVEFEGDGHAAFYWRELERIT